MTDTTLEQRARELLAKWRNAAFEGYQTGIAHIDEATANRVSAKMECADELEAALRLPAGVDGWVLELYRDRDGELGIWVKQDGGSRVWIARAAAPRHETGT